MTFCPRSKQCVSDRMDGVIEIKGPDLHTTGSVSDFVCVVRLNGTPAPLRGTALTPGGNKQKIAPGLAERISRAAANGRAVSRATAIRAQFSNSSSAIVS